MLASVMQKFNLIKFGLVGTIVTAICCFTPFLTIVFGMAGLSSALGTLDIILFPLLAIFIGITIYALWKKSKT
ncbi:MAG: mercuric ion transport protein [Urechidicola sp.]|jgi:mercuric ion transport protein